MTHHLDIDAHGRLVPDEEARNTLGDRAGRFVILPSSPDLLLARRTPAAGGVASHPRCILAGDLGVFPVADFVSFVHQSRLSGKLTVSAPGLERAVVFKDGEVRSVQSRVAGEQLDDIALRLGYVTERDVAETSESVPGHLLSKALVDGGFISAPDMWKCVHEQVAEVVHSILLAQEGVFEMIEYAERELGPPLSVNTQALLLEGLRRIDELSLFRSRIPGSSAFVRRRSASVPITLKPIEKRLLELVDGQRRVSGIAQAAHLSEFEVTKVLFHLSEAGYVETSDEPSASSELPSGERLETIAEKMNEVLRDIGTVLAGEGALDALLAGDRAFLSDPEGRFAPLWNLVALERDASVDLASVLGNAGGLKGAALTKLEPSGDVARLLFDGLRELVLFDLFFASERLAREPDERLALSVKQRLDAIRGLL